ncbi:hypothetical protein Tco_0177108, partial [Tanacetum coccineum]
FSDPTLQGVSSSAVIRGFGLRDEQAAKVDKKKFPVVGDPFGQTLDIGGLDDHVMVDELSAKGQYVGSSGNQSLAFVSVGVSAYTTHTAVEGHALPSWLKARYESLLVAYQDLQT